MRDATLAMRTILNRISSFRPGVLALTLALAFAYAPTGYADDIGTESEDEENSERSVLLILDGGIRYEGTVSHGKVHGKGTLTFPDGRIYEGEFMGGEIEGEGTYSYPDGRNYVGEFRNGMRNGSGVLEFPSGEIYDGQWLDDKKNGQGIVIWPDGERYEGEFRDGLIADL